MTPELKEQRRSALEKQAKRLNDERCGLPVAECPEELQKKIAAHKAAVKKFREDEEKDYEKVLKAPVKHTGYAIIFKKWLTDEWKEATTGEMMVLVVLVAYGAKSGKCFLGMRSLATLTHMAIATVERCIAGLQKKGIIEITKKGGSNNVYRIVK